MQVDVSERLSEVRRRMDSAGLGLLIVRGTDRYRSNFVPASESLRAWLTGYDGGVGDALVSLEQAILFVPACDRLLAERQVTATDVSVVPVPFGTSVLAALLGQVRGLCTDGMKVGVESETTSMAERGAIVANIEASRGHCIALDDNLVARARGSATPPRSDRLQVIADGVTGEAVGAKLEHVREFLRKTGTDAMLVTRLDEIAWLTNMRSYELEHAATFRSIAWIDSEMALLCVDPEKVAPAVQKARGRHWTFHPEATWVEVISRRLGRREGVRVIVDPSVTTVGTAERLITALGDHGRIVETASPVRALAAMKNKRELDTMRDGMRRADRVMSDAIRWLNKTVSKGKGVSERRLADELETLFRNAGARALAFPVIASAGAGAAHAYGASPDPTRRIRAGELVLLETGALFESGYATALCRTVLVGGSARVTKQQKEVFTAVLSAAIRGMRARFPRGTTGGQLDAVVRSSMWSSGLDYPHATGSGIGIGVRESPPRIAPEADSVLEPGMLFSIAPGAYIDNWGGVRIGNVVCVEEEPKVPGFLRLRPVTLAPVDRRLIDGKRLSSDDKSWLRRYLRGQV